jgi:hypothetical protein
MGGPGMQKGSTHTLTGLAKVTYNIKVWGTDRELLMNEKIIKE